MQDDQECKVVRQDRHAEWSVLCGDLHDLNIKPKNAGLTHPLYMNGYTWQMSCTGRYWAYLVCQPGFIRPGFRADIFRFSDEDPCNARRLTRDV